MRAICSLSSLEAAAELLLVMEFDHVFSIAATSDGLIAAIPLSIFATLLRSVTASLARANPLQRVSNPVTWEEENGKILSLA